MATQHSRAAARLMISPSVVMLILWMAIPLGMTVYFSFQRYNLLMPGQGGWVGFENYAFFVTSPAFTAALINTLLLVGGVLLVTVIGGTLLALLLDQEVFGQGVARILTISPFFVMPTVSALVFKNMFMNPVNGLLAWLWQLVGLQPVDWLADLPLFSITMMVSWTWLPFATLILLTSLQSLDRDQIEAAEMDGAGPVARFVHVIVPHLARAGTVVILIETIFLLSIFAEILVTTNGGPGTASTNLTYLVYAESLLRFDVGTGAAGGVIAVILANIVAIFLMRMIGKNLDA